MSKKLLLTVALVLLVSLAVAGIAGAATPRGIGLSGIVSNIDYANDVFDVTSGSNTTTYNHHWSTLYFDHPACQVNNFGELMVGNAVGVASLTVGVDEWTRAIVVFPGLCPQNP